MRLIDADKLIARRAENDPVRIAAESEPTAYDVEKVCKQLEEKTRCIYAVDEDLELTPEFAINAIFALNIVRKGGMM